MGANISQGCLLILLKDPADLFCKSPDRRCSIFIYQSYICSAFFKKVIIVPQFSCSIFSTAEGKEIEQINSLENAGLILADKGNCQCPVV